MSPVGGTTSDHAGRPDAVARVPDDLCGRRADVHPMRRRRRRPIPPPEPPQTAGSSPPAPAPSPTRSSSPNLIRHAGRGGQRSGHAGDPVYLARTPDENSGYAPTFVWSKGRAAALPSIGPACGPEQLGGRTPRPAAGPDGEPVLPFGGPLNDTTGQHRDSARNPGRRRQSVSTWPGLTDPNLALEAIAPCGGGTGAAPAQTAAADARFLAARASSSPTIGNAWTFRPRNSSRKWS